MKPQLFLRIAAGMLLLHNIGHTMGHIGWKHPDNPVQRHVIGKMVENTFSFMGSTASYARFYEGYGYAGTLTLLLVMVLLWIYSGGGRKDSLLPVTVCAVFLICWAVMELIYFFPLAAGLTFVAAFLCLLAAFLIRRSQGNAMDSNR